MKCLIKRRARKTEQKEERRRLILETAKELLAAYSYEELKLAEIAKRMGIVKGTLYLYFQSKEELCLAILEEEAIAAFRNLRERVQSIKTHKELVAAAVAEMVERPLLLDLHLISNRILEKNVQVERAIEMKLAILSELKATAALLEEKIEFMREGTGLHFLMTFIALALGMRLHAKPAAPVVEAIRRTEALQLFQPNFERDLTTATLLLLEGIKSSQGEGGV